MKLMTTIVVYFKIDFSTVNFVGVLSLKHSNDAVFQGIGGKIGRTQLIKSDRCQKGVYYD